MPQAVDVKIFNKGMNKDVDPRFLQAGEYVDANNIMLSNYREGKSGGVTNFPGLNRLKDYTGSTILGVFEDNLNNVLYIFSYTSSSVKTIEKLTLSTDVFSNIVVSANLPFTASTIIKSCKVIEGILIWTDGTGEIGMYDQNVTYPGTITEEMFTLAQTVPQNKPDIDSLIDASYGYNNILAKFFQFKYRYVFESGYKSVFSPISEVAYSYDDYSSPELISGSNNSVNAIDITVHGVGAHGLVSKIQIAARSGNNGDFFLIKEIDATSAFQAGGSITHRFYNESLYDPIALKESNQIYDDVPCDVQTLEIADNRVITGDVRTGYDEMDLDYDIDVVYNNASDTDAVVNNTTGRTEMNNATSLGVFFALSGAGDFDYPNPVAGDKILCTGISLGTYLNPFGDVTITIEDGDSWNSIYTKLTTPEFWNAAISEWMALMDISTNNIPPDSVATGNDAFQFTLWQHQHATTFKSGSWYNVGFQYFDLYGRTPGTQTKDDSEIYIQTIPERSGVTGDSLTNVGHATINITIRHEAPSWAVYYKIVYSSAIVSDSSIQIATRGATAEGVSNVLLNIGSILEWNEEKGGNLAYIWEKGDRVKIITQDSSNGYDIYKDWATELIDAEIIGDDSTGDYSIIIPKISGLSQSHSVSALSTGAIIEIYRPSKELDSSKSIFTEANPDYKIYESSGSYYHRGDVDQTSSVDGEVGITGDAYIKGREDFPYGTTPLYAEIAFEGYDISDYRDSAHYDKGRPTAIINQEETHRLSTIMYSETIIPNTDINELNRFYPDENFEEYEKSFGRIILLYNEEDHLLMLQEDRASKIYINRSVLYDGSGNAQLVGTQKNVLSSSVPYSGIYGIHDYRSFKAIGNRRYWLDAARGVAIRLSNNGIEEISRYGMRGWFSEVCESLLDSADEKVTSVYDIQNDVYMLHFSAEDKTAVFDEKNNAWISFVQYISPDFSVFINNRVFSAEGDKLFELNYYTVKNAQYEGGAYTAYDSYIEFSSNVEPAELKNYLALLLDSSHTLNVNIGTEAIGGGTNQASTLDRSLDFRQREQEWHASFLRDSNTPNVSNPLLEGDTIKGKHANIKLTLPGGLSTSPDTVSDEDFTLKMVKIVISKG